MSKDDTNCKNKSTASYTCCWTVLKLLRYKVQHTKTQATFGFERCEIMRGAVGFDARGQIVSLSGCHLLSVWCVIALNTIIVIRKCFRRLCPQKRGCFLGSRCLVHPTQCLRTFQLRSIQDFFIHWFSGLFLEQNIVRSKFAVESVGKKSWMLVERTNRWDELATQFGMSSTQR